MAGPYPLIDDRDAAVYRRKIADCDDRLDKYGAAIEAGTNPAIVAGWIREVEAERLIAEPELGATAPAKPLTKAEVRGLITDLQDSVSKLTDAEPALKAEIYAELGLQCVYDPDQQRITIDTQPRCIQVRVGGAFGPLSTPPLLRGSEVLLRTA
jgi:hypothetical protein